MQHQNSRKKNRNGSKPLKTYHENYLWGDEHPFTIVFPGKNLGQSRKKNPGF